MPRPVRATVCRAVPPPLQARLTSTGAAEASAESTIAPDVLAPVLEAQPLLHEALGAPPPERAILGLCSPAKAPSRTMVTAFLSP